MSEIEDRAGEYAAEMRAEARAARDAEIDRWVEADEPDAAEQAEIERDAREWVR